MRITEALRNGIVALILLGTVGEAVACSCMRDQDAERSFQAEVCGSDWIFIGRALAPTAHPEHKISSTLIVRDIFKGDVPGLARSIPGQSTMCHREFQRGRTYLVFAGSRDKGKRFVSSVCGLSHADPSREFLDKLEKYIADAARVCSQDFDALRKRDKRQEFIQLLEETRSVLDTEPDADSDDSKTKGAVSAGDGDS